MQAPEKKSGDGVSPRRIILGRTLRNIREALKYPAWIVKGSPPPDNHHFKVRRIKKLAAEYKCDTLIETGTFFGQTVAAARPRFKKVISVELSDALYEGNRKSFERCPNVVILHGDSSNRLAEMIDQAEGRILFWLDGHYSDGITACGAEVTPILNELHTIKAKGRRHDCILIDDVRLFIGKQGYPEIDRAKEAIRQINGSYDIATDHDCLIARPPRTAVA